MQTHSVENMLESKQKQPKSKHQVGCTNWPSNRVRLRFAGGVDFRSVSGHASCRAAAHRGIEE